MKFGVPWSVKGIRPEARETAKEAARRSGMPLGEWLNSVILEQAADLDDDEDAYGHDMSAVHERLDDITRRLDQFSRKGPEAYAPRRQRQAEPQANASNDQLAQLIARLDQRIEQLAALPRMMAPYAPPLPQQPVQPAWAPPPMAAAPAMRPPMASPAPTTPAGMPFGLDRAVAEIAARQRSLNGAPAQAQAQAQPIQAAPQPPLPQAVTTPAYMPQPVPSQDLSGLEDRLRQITDQIETLRKPGVEDAINALRAELSDINRALADAMPRQAIDAIERQIQGLTQRIAEGRQNGGDHGALTGIEHGLAEVRDVLRGLTPAENLVGFNDAVEGLAHKIDMIVARRDPETLGQLEHAITTLRDMAEHVASNEAVGRLAAQVAELGDKVDHFAMGGASDALNSLEHRINALSDALATRSQNGAAVPPRLEALVESLSDKIEQIQQSRGDNVGVGHLEDQIVTLVQRLDASDSRLGHLEAIERGLGDLLVHIEELRANKAPAGPRGEASPAVTDLQQQLARTQSALDAMHGTLGIVVDRLATIEKGVTRGEPRPAVYDDAMELTEPVGRIASRVILDEPAAPVPPAPREMQAPLPNGPAGKPPMPPAPELAAALAPPPAPRPAPPQQTPQPQPQARRLPPAPRLPINPELPPDQPLEPGTVPPRFGGNPGARIAASEAALAGIGEKGDKGPTGKSGFIAAARRAAQAAMESAKPRAPRADEIEALTETDAPSSLRASVFKKIKQVLIAASLVAIVIGGIQLASTFFNIGDLVSRKAPEPKVEAPKGPANNGEAPAPQSSTEDPLVTHSVTAPVKPLDMPGYMMGAPLGASGPIRNVTPGYKPPRDDSSSLLTAPALNPPPPTTAPGNDVTGSIPRAPKAKPAAPQADGDLPASIGSEKLREAAAAGDAGAAFEVAQRFAEGRGVAASPEEAARWYERAAAKGLAVAQFRYASMLEKGQGVKKNLGQARKFYVAAASKGHAKAMHNLAVLYAEGIDGKPDYATAAKWFRKAADHDVGDSQYNLGVLCARGLGVEKNLSEAYQWFALAAAKGDHEAGRKRDEIASRLEPDELTAAQNAVKSFKAQEQPAAATTVPTPRGGWDATGSAEPAAPKTHVRSRAAPQAASASAPLNIGAVARR
ncbi:MAG: SEL1-like repeat protein [Proteobacteria bacterium]|nr:SEL1-like repeat protein [Pseudomonadota bacterium]